MNTQTAALVEKLRQASRGQDEWRVQDENGSYWIAFARGDGYTLDPEREAREWLADQQKHNPGHAKARGTVACVQVQTQAQELMQEAAEAMAKMAAELDAHRLYARALCKAVDAATYFAGTVAGGAAWWDDVWADHAAALDRARANISAASGA